MPPKAVGPRHMTNTDKTHLGDTMKKIITIAAVLLLSACATGPGTEIQEDPDGFDAPRKSPCACDPIPYERPSYSWSFS